MKEQRRIKKKVQRASTLGRILGGLWYTSVIAAACGVGVVASMMGRSSIVNAIFKNPLALLNTDPKETFHTPEGITMLILGTDDDRVQTGWEKGPNGKYHSVSKVTRRGARADMIMVARLDFAKKTITGLSVPRDTACRLAGYDNPRIVKINGYFGAAPKGQGKEVMREAVEHILPGVHIDRVVALNYDGFRGLVNTVQGVPVVVQKGPKGEGLQYDDWSGDLHIHLKPGPHVLDGEEAMEYVRYRHDSESDYGRQERQKEFLTSFKNSVLHHLLQIPEIAEQGKAAMGNALSDQEIIALVAFARNVPQNSIKLGMLPTTEGSTRGGALRVDRVHRDAALRQYGLLNGDTETAVSEG